MLSIRTSIIISFLFFFIVTTYSQEGLRTRYPKAKKKTVHIEKNFSVLSDSYINESFEYTTFPPAGWTKINAVAESSGWDRIQVGTVPIPGWNGGTVSPTPDGLGGNFVTWMNYTLGGAASNDNWLITPLLENVESGDSLTFWLRMFSNEYADNVDIKISTSINNDTSAFNIIVDTLVLNDAEADTGWKYYSYDISTLVPAGSDIYVGFREYVPDNEVDGNAIFLDQVKLGSEIGPGTAADPEPVNGEDDVNNDVDLNWTNPTGSTSIEIFLGEDPESWVSVYSGSPLSTWDPGILDYNTTYYWRIDETDSEGTTTGYLWSFSTEKDPNSVIVFIEDFESDLSNWSITNQGGSCDWDIWDSSTWQSSSLPILPNGTAGQWLGANSDGCGDGSTMNTLITMNSSINLNPFQNIILSYESDFRVWINDFGLLDISVDGGDTWTNLITLQSVTIRNEIKEIDISSIAAMQSDVRLRFSYSGEFDYWWSLDNIIIYGSDVIPVELSSFNAYVMNGKINLSWQTASETNNYGFDVERKALGEGFAKVGFVAGYGTSTEDKNYVLVDNNVAAGVYAYRLKQIDFDGTFEYSKEVKVEVTPSKFSLDQNYPNPFNPITKIEFSLATDSRVTLKIFDILGQEILNLVDGSLSAGVHSLNYNASSLNSGVYLLTLEAKGIDGTNFNSTKKMILTK